MARKKQKNVDNVLITSGNNQIDTTRAIGSTSVIPQKSSATTGIPTPLPSSFQTILSTYATQNTTTIKTIPEKTIPEEQIQALRDLGIPPDKMARLILMKNATSLAKQLIDHYATFTSFGFSQNDIIGIALRTEGEKVLKAFLTCYKQMTSQYKFTHEQIKQITTTGSGDRNLTTVYENYAALTAILKNDSTPIIVNEEIQKINREIVDIAINFHGDKNIITLIKRYNNLLEKKYTKAQIILLAKYHNASSLMEALNTHHYKFMEHGFNHKQLIAIACNCKNLSQNLDKLYAYLCKLGDQALSADVLTQKLVKRDVKFLEGISLIVPEPIKNPLYGAVPTMPSIAKRPGFFPLPGVTPSIATEVQQKKHKTQDTQSQQKFFESAFVPMPWHVQSGVSPINAQNVGKSIGTTLTRQMVDRPKVDVLQPDHPAKLKLNSVYNEITAILEHAGYSELERERSLIAISAHIVSLLELKLPIDAIAKISVLPICDHVAASLITYSIKCKIIGDELATFVNQLINPKEITKRRRHYVPKPVHDGSILSTQTNQSNTHQISNESAICKDLSTDVTAYNVENPFKFYQPVTSQNSIPFATSVKIEPIIIEDELQLKTNTSERQYTNFKFDEIALENSFKQWSAEIDSVEPSTQLTQSTYPKMNQQA